MANTDGTGAPKPPPNLRVSQDENKECDNCTHYLRGKCHMYDNLPVDGEWVCDSWEKGENQDPDEEAEDEAYGKPASEQPKTLAEARIRVREHFRRRSAT